MRAIVCDPVCAQPFGHNAPALNLFGKALGKAFSVVETVCCRFLPKDLIEKYGFFPHYDFYYHDYIKLRNAAAAIESNASSVNTSFVDSLEAIATADVQSLIKIKNIGFDDTIVFPSVDFYGLIGAFNALADMPANQRPRLLLRFIGVMEDASKFYREPIAELAARLIEAREAGIRMALTAETPKLADWLSAMFDADVSVTPYPDVHNPLPFPKMGTFNVYCPGSARPDKGFFELLEIFTQLRRRDRKMNIRFITQSLSANDAPHHQDYMSRLYAVPGLELLPGVISDEMMVHQFSRSSVILLPYDRGIYARRGSAAMMEAACWGRPVITLAGTAFAEQVSWYRLGAVVNSPSEMIDEVLTLSQQPRDKLERKMLRSRARFLNDVEGSYKEWLTPAP